MTSNVFGGGTGSEQEIRPVNELSYEEARDELVETVKLLELGQMGLDESLALWERGEALAKRCEEQLAGARERIEKTLADAENNGGYQGPTRSG